MKCLIIAAGKGSRLRSKTGSKPLTPLLGVPIIERVVRSALEAGADDFYVVTGYRSERIHTFLDNLSNRLGISITILVNGSWEKENGLSVLRAKDVLHEPFLLLMADHLFDPAIARELIALPASNGGITLAVDSDTHNPAIDLVDVTRVRTENGKIRDIGKGLEDFNGFDTGIFLCTPAIFDALEHCVKKYGDTTLSGAVRVLAAQGRANVFDVNGHFWIDVDDVAAFRRAEKALLSTLRGKPTDGFVSRYLNRPCSVRISRHLVKLRVTPNQVSVLSFVVACISSLFFIVGNAVVGAILVQLASILDGCDGEIARLRHMQCSFGDFVDAVLDRYADGFIFFGIFYYSLSVVGNTNVLGITVSPLIVSGIFVLAVVGNLMVSYTSAKSVVNFGYRYEGKWIASGRGRDIRLLQLFVGGLMTSFHPLFALVALLVIAVQTNTIVLWRVLLSKRRFQQKVVPRKQHRIAEADRFFVSHV